MDSQDSHSARPTQPGAEQAPDQEGDITGDMTGDITGTTGKAPQATLTPAAAPDDEDGALDDANGLDGDDGFEASAPPAAHAEGISPEFGDARVEDDEAAADALMHPGATDVSDAMRMAGDMSAPPKSSSLTFRGLALDRFQAEAITQLTLGNSVLVSAPTGTGKTIIADYVVDQALKEGREVVYTAPIKALSNQKYRDYTRLYGKQNVGLITGDLVINREAPIRIMTTEIMRNILLQEECSEKLSHVVVDEVHFLEDEERGTVWEELLIYLPPRVKIVALSATLPNIDEFAQWLESVRGDRVAVIKEHRRAVPLRLLAANKTTGILEIRRFEGEFKRWLEHGRSQARDGGGRDGWNRDGRSGGRDGAGGGSDRHSDFRGERRSDVRYGFTDNRQGDSRHGNRHGGRNDGRNDNRYDNRHDNRSGGRPEHGNNRFGGQDERNGRPVKIETRHLDVVAMATPDFLPVLYFIFSRRQTEMFARELSRRTRRSFLNRFEQNQVEQILREFEIASPGVLTPEHDQMYMAGIAFHHAGVHVSLKALVEEMYERRLVKVLYCTSTFALGINMPARSVIFDSLRKFNGHAVVPLTVRQFLQKAGRAGRRGMDKEGFVIIREDFGDYPNDRLLFKNYQKGEHERIQSAFNLSFSSVVNLLHRHTQEEIRKILEKSFLNFTARKALESQREQLALMGARVEAMHSANDPGAKDLMRRWKKHAGRVERQLDHQEGLIYARFVEKVDFLKGAGYINDDLAFNAGAKALMHIQINEIFVTELLLEGVFDEVDEDELFGILTGLVQDLPRSVVVRDPTRGRWNRLRERIRRVRDSENVSRAAELLGQPVTLCPELMPYGQLWAQGRSLAELLVTVQSDVDISGDLVGAFRRAKDLAGQLRSACKENEILTERLKSLVTKVSRDEVEVLD